jgi:RNA polymerase sigma-70 factor (ECF subfamily)
MTGEEASFDDLMRRVRAGDPEAAGEMYERYGHHIRRIVRSRLHRRLRKQYDSLDFVQSVWAVFIQIPPERRQFDTPDDLVGFLARLACNKIVDVYRRRAQSAAYGSANREISLEAVARKEEAPIPSHAPTPSQTAMAREQWEKLVRDQAPLLRRILELLRQGYSHEEIGDVLGLNPKFVQRFLQKLHRRKGPA